MLLLKPALISIAVTSLMLVLLTPVWILGALYGTCLLPRVNTFNGILWRIDDGQSVCSLRGQMADDVISHELRPGMTEQHVLALLGEPAHPAESVEGARDALVYKLGCWIDCNWLVVQFDAENRLTEAFSYQD